MANTNLLKFHAQLQIDRQYFFNLSDEERSILLQWSWGLKTGDVKKNDKGQLVLGNQLLGNIAWNLRKVRFQFQRDQTENKLERIWLELFGVRFRAWKIDGHAIFESIKPFEIDRLEQVFRDSGAWLKIERIKAGYQMAIKMNCKDVSEFAAVYELTVRRLSKHDHQSFETNQDKQNEIKDSIMELIEETKELHDTSDHKLSFVNELVAANHFEKHPIKHEGRNFTPGEYIALARELASGMADYVAKDIQLTQEGTTFKCTFKGDDNVFALRIDKVTDGTSVIATLYQMGLKGQRKDMGSNKPAKVIRTKRKKKNADACKG